LHNSSRRSAWNSSVDGIARALDGVFLRCGQQFARLMIAKGWRFAFAAFRPRPLDAFDRVMGDGVLLVGQ